MVLLSVIAAGCAGTGSPEIRIAWNELEEVNAGLPPEIRVYAGADPSIPLRAWAVRARTGRDGVVTRVAVSDDDDGRETPSDFARRLGARVVVNGGYFRMDLDPAAHVGLLMVDGRIVAPATRSVLRDDRRYFLARGAFGVMADGSVDIAWISSREGVLYEWQDPPPNTPDDPVEELDVEGLRPWPARDAIAAGPVLMQEGRLRITTEEEVFFGSTIPDVHPRTAACVTDTGELVLLVVDGRQRDSRGVDLVELAILLRDLGCDEAINLDGGGSSALIVDGRLLNRPAGGEEERQVMSVVALIDP
jgi:exopolysaccharide biosynthesis protein